MEHYRDFVKLAHSKGIKVIQDVVLNHAGPVFYYDVNGDGVFNVEQKGRVGAAVQDATASTPTRSGRTCRSGTRHAPSRTGRASC